MILIITSRDGNLDIKINCNNEDLYNNNLEIDFEHTPNIVYSEDLKTKLSELLKTIKIKE
jgi:hypothetical protein